MVHFTARLSRRANLDERNRNNNKSAVRAKKASMRDAFRAKATDKNLTAEWRPDCSNSLSSQVFYLSAQRERAWQRQPTHPFWFQPCLPTPLLYQINCSCPLLLMAISRSSALKINTKARITHLQELATLLSLPCFCACCLCMFGLLVERLALRLNEVELKNRGVSI